MKILCNQTKKIDVTKNIGVRYWVGFLINYKRIAKSDKRCSPYFVKMLAFPDDLVLDPFVGKGVIVRVAKGLNRKSIGIDIDAD